MNEIMTSTASGKVWQFLKLNSFPICNLRHLDHWEETAAGRYTHFSHGICRRQEIYIRNRQKNLLKKACDSNIPVIQDSIADSIKMDSERIGKEESCLGMKVLGYEIETFMNDSISFSISLS